MKTIILRKGKEESLGRFHPWIFSGAIHHTEGDKLEEGDIVEVVSDASTETILTAEMPVKTVLQITYMEPGAKGNTATNTLTKATVETGGTVLVPLFCKEGDKIVVDTRDGSYVERAKE
jgi:elongation factor P